MPIIDVFSGFILLRQKNHTLHVRLEKALKGGDYLNLRIFIFKRKAKPIKQESIKDPP